MEAKHVRWSTYKILLGFLMVFILGCSTTSGVKPLGLSKSLFDSGSSRAETVILNRDASEGDYYRAFEEDYFGSIAELKDKTAQNADAFCGSQGKAVKPIRETTSKPPHLILFGNTPRVELIFTCIDKPQPATPVKTAPPAPAALTAEKPAAVDQPATASPVHPEKQAPVAVEKPAPAAPTISQQPAPKAPSTFDDVKYDKLLKLKKLLDNGILTKEEFAREKTKILNE